ncbi:arylamine N-acetyltransferase family protein [Actinomadura algeriensis]|uniref:N-hydroxyarylamine O-acetyltransferase n=1 Tax=Actinomadura algeriensis TaxID=1679523 RepID=A0ABR9JQD0_9ACTN|nr:arylamine N-acetyltransferase [Actinomadura algeriensis]MBE1532775.1 N-hydroxyarylamine O-acetyltransferase [Actinomadura algeriensis]
MTEDLGLGWRGDALDLPAYLKRVGLGADLPPTEATLRALHRAHITSVPFENLEIMLGRPIAVDLESVQAKLVDRPRGGYCFEHSGLFAAVLERLGFEVRGLVARVMMGADKLRPTTHGILRVRLPGQAPDEPGWLADTGFGAGPLEPVRFVDGAEDDQDGWGYRLRRGDTHAWELHHRTPDGWMRRHMFDENEAYRVDFEALNFYVYAHPHSPFTTRPFVQRFLPDSHHVLDGTTVTVTRPDGSVETRAHTPAALPDVLASDFAITLEGDDPGRLVAWLEARA